MQTNAKTFDTYLGCDNCGHEDTYTLPLRRRIVEYASALLNPNGEMVYSAYERINGSDHTTLACRYCKLPCLRVLWWADQPVVKKKKVSRHA